MMKIKIISAAISFSLLGCVTTTTGEQTAEAILDNENQPAVVETSTTASPVLAPVIASAFKKQEPKTAVAKIVESVSKPQMASNGEITLEQIMSDPDWMGRSPESWYWGDDSQTVLYKQKQLGNPLRDLVKKSLQSKGNGEKVKLANMHINADQNAQTNRAGTHEVYVFEGNVFLKEIASQKVQQLTYTSAIERSAMFLNNGNVAYRVVDTFFEHDVKNSKIIELASLQMKKAPDDAENSPSYIAGEQSKLIAYIALQQRNKKLKDEKGEKLKAENKTLTKSEFYFGDGNRVVNASLSPNGDKMIVSIASSKSSRDSSDIMPNYIAEDGHIKAEKVRHRVADNRQYSQELFLLDLVTGQQFPLSYETLPGFDEDVLASVKTENYAREGKTYQSEKAPRNIHVMRAFNAIQWHKDGKKVALLLEAWDNKDRWLASVNLLENKLVAQHRLHDDAWVNYTFNEFGWINDNLYYLSEESGYSHLYTKSLKGKAKKLTSG
ncbi:MAG: DPP IV N-terminal domain-containing protein, partial [Thalassotalea sp.]|nr:DPP IV N-terminal domain-containing protein [Thalassotalea sp.]